MLHHAADVLSSRRPTIDTERSQAAYQSCGYCFGGPSGCFSHAGGCSALHDMVAIRHRPSVRIIVNTSTPQCDHWPSRYRSYGYHTIATGPLTRASGRNPRSVTLRVTGAARCSARVRTRYLVSPSRVLVGNMTASVSIRSVRAVMSP